MNPLTVFCPNLACHASGHVGKGNITIHQRARQRYRCRECRMTFTLRTGTPMAHKQTALDQIALVLALVTAGCPIAAITAVFGLDRRTVRRWIHDAGSHAQRVHQHLILQPRELGMVQADEIRLKLQGAIVWMAMAIVVGPQLWLGGVVSRHRDRALIHGLWTLVRQSARPGKRLLLISDGLRHYRTTAAQVFRIARPTGRRGGVPQRAWPGLVLVQIVKTTRGTIWQPWSRTDLRRGKRIGWVVRRTRGCTVASTAAIERLNATLRERCAAWARRSRHLGQRVDAVEPLLYLMGAVYNFCTEHGSLQQTPAMAAGITGHRWSVGELVTYRVTPPPWQPPKRSGRPSKHVLALIERWQR
jgi:transposase-like protein